MKQIKIFLILLIFLALTTACSHSTFRLKEITLRKNPKIAMVAFKNLSSYPKAGQIVAETMTIELRRTNKFRILDLTQTAKAVKKHRTDYRAIGKTMKSHYVLSGTVNEYRYTKGLAENPTIAIQVKIISTRTGNVIWQGSGADVSNPTLLSRAASLSELLHSICQRIIAYMETK